MRVSIKKTILLVLCALSFAAALFAGACTMRPQRYAVRQDGLPIREKPSYGARVLRKLSKDDQVTVVRYIAPGNYWLVDAGDGVMGYADHRYLNKVSKKPAPEIPVATDAKTDAGKASVPDPRNIAEPPEASAAAAGTICLYAAGVVSLILTLILSMPVAVLVGIALFVVYGLVMSHGLVTAESAGNDTKFLYGPDGREYHIRDLGNDFGRDPYGNDWMKNGSSYIPTK